jgi:hypothetical protein
MGTTKMRSTGFSKTDCVVTLFFPWSLGLHLPSSYDSNFLAS